MAKKPKNPEPATPKFSPIWILLLILSFSLLSKTYRLSIPEKYYFDEIYYAFTAERMAAGDKNVYDPWAKPPEGVAYEWTHPPLPKLLMAGSIQALGDNSFAWRIGSAVAGTAAVALTALLALELFASWPLALLAAFLLSLEGLSLTMARIATADSYFAAFTLLAFLAYSRWKKRGKLSNLLLASFALGLALSSKWTALFPLAAIYADLFTNLQWPDRRRPAWNKILPAAFAFAIVPAVVYLASYSQFFYLGGTWEQLTQLQHQMWAYHSGLKNSHSFSSHPIHWIFNLRPVWFHSDVPAPGLQTDIFNLGNSIILIAGFLAILQQLLREPRFAWEKRFLLFLYFALWVPWAISPRVMFFYHYVPAVPLLCILLARFVANAGVKSRRLGATLMVTAAAWCLFTYPLAAGIPVPVWLVNNFYSSIPGLEKR